MLRCALLLVLAACGLRPPPEDTSPDDTAAPADTDTADTDTDADADTDADTGPFDADGDGSLDAYDCDDTDATIHPGAFEYCDGVDNDCDTNVDEEAVDSLPFYIDADRDGYGAGELYLACFDRVGASRYGTDCDDDDYTVNPGAAEVCNGVDDDCDDTVDLGAADPSDWYFDGDEDGHGDAALVVTTCDAPEGYVADADDCDDGRADTHPGAAEACDADDRDEDCDGLADDADPSATGSTPFYADADGDTFGDATVSAITCDAPAGYLADASDCDDTNAAISPDATETCNTADDDCDGLVDDADPSATGGTAWYADTDGDSFGDAAASVSACDAPAGYGADASDCDDTNAAISPDATETCNTADDDCDGTADDGDVCLVCGAWDWLTVPAAWSYTRPTSVSYDVATTVYTVAGGAGPTYTLTADSYVHWDGADPSYAYIGAETKSVVATFTCDTGVVTLDALDIVMDGYGGYGSYHAWGMDGTITLDPPVAVWREGEAAWPESTTARWDYYDTAYGAYTRTTANIPETWSFAVGSLEAVDLATGPVDATPLALTWSGGAYSNPWTLLFGATTWLDASAPVAWGSPTSRYLRE